MGSVRVAIVGVGNCATSLIQGVEYYKDADPLANVPGLMHVQFGDYHVSDIEFVAAFDVDAKKVGFDLADATDGLARTTRSASPTCRRPASRSSEATRLTDWASTTARRSRSPTPSRSTLSRVLKETKADVLVSYLPVGSEEADKFYAQCAIDAKVAFVNALPVFIASDPEWAAKFEAAGVPIVGDDIKSQVGATITHRVLAKLFEDRGVRSRPHLPAQRRRQHGLQEHARARSPRVQEDLQDPGRDLQPGARRQDSTATCTSARPTTSRGSTTASGPTSASRVARSATCR